MKPRVILTSILAILLILIGIPTYAITEVTFFGPQIYEREKGKPFTETVHFTISNPSGAGKLIIHNGGEKKTRVSSAEIKFNGVLVFGPGDFNKNIEYLEADIPLEINNEISIKLMSKPESYLTVKVIKEVAVSVTLDEANSVSTLLTSEGGAITTTGTDAKYTLTFPPYALSAPTEITFTPISSIVGLPFSQGMLAAVRMNPEGLQLKIPATLDIELQPPVNLSGQIAIGFMFQEGGEGFHLRAAESDGNKVTMQFNHFTGAGVSLLDEEEKFKEAYECIIDRYFGPAGLLSQLRTIATSPGLICMIADSVLDFMKLHDMACETMNKFITEPLQGCVYDNPNSVCTTILELQDAALESFNIAASKYLVEANQGCLEGDSSKEVLFCEILDCIDILNEFATSNTWLDFDILSKFTELKTCGIYDVDIVPPPPPSPHGPYGECFEVGETLQLETVAKDKQGNVLEGRDIDWISLEPNIATVDDTGLVTAEGVGLAKVKVQDKQCAPTLPFSSELPGAFSSLTFEVLPSVASIDITPAKRTIKIDDVLLLTATAKDADGNPLNCPDIFLWSPEYLLVVDVNPSSGKTTTVKGLSQGEVKVIAAAEGVIGEATITVTEPSGPPVVGWVEIDTEQGCLQVGETLRLRATVYDLNGDIINNYPINWYDWYPDIATVDQMTGLVTGESDGWELIEACAGDECANVLVGVSSLGIEYVIDKGATWAIPLEPYKSWVLSEFPLPNIPGARSINNRDFYVRDTDESVVTVGTYSIEPFPTLGFIFDGEYLTTIQAPWVPDVDECIGGCSGGTDVHAVNDSGEVVGNATGEGNYESGMLYGNGIYERIDYPGPDGLLYGNCSLKDINNSGQIVGDRRGVGFLYENGNFTPINPAPGIQSSVSAQSINNFGQIVGYYKVNPEPYVSFDRGFIYDNGQYITFDIPMARDTQPFDIHESGQIDVRAYFTEAPSLRWFRLQPCR